SSTKQGAGRLTPPGSESLRSPSASGVAAGSSGGSGVDVQQVVLLDRLSRCCRIHVAALGQGLQGPGDDRRGVDEEVAPHRGAGVGETETIGSQGPVVARYPGADLVRHLEVVVAGADERALGTAQFGGQVGLALLALGVDEGL